MIGAARSKKTGGRLHRGENGPFPLWIALIILLGIGSCLSAAEPNHGSLLVGIASSVRSPERAFSYGSLEYRYEFGSGKLSALTCVEWNGGNCYASVGFFFNIYQSSRFTVGIGSGPGFLNHGRFTLGNKLEFRSIAEIQMKVSRRCSVGIDYCHYSNAGTGSINPGAESIRFFIAIRM